MTNRDLYLRIGELGERYASCDRPLEHYLLALLWLARTHHDQSDQTTLSPDDFCRLLTEAFIADPLPFEAVWREEYSALNPDQPGFAGWEATLTRQIVDLREMEEAGTLDNEDRYFGVDAPHGSRWYNFHPVPYLECAMAGSFGGWEPGDTTGRQFVVAVQDSAGPLQSMAPQELESPLFEMPEFSWKQFQDFLECGQMYE